MDQALKLQRATYHLWTFTISKLISTFGAQVYAFGISFYILQLTGSATSFALNLICNLLPRALIAPVVGYAADNYSRKTIIISAQIGTTFAIGGLLFVSLTSGLSLIAIYITTCLLSIASTFSTVTFTSSITGLIDEERIQKAMSLNQMSISFASIGSPAVGGLLYGVVSMPVFLIIFILASVLAVILESTMNFKLFSKKNEEQNKENGKEPIWASMKAGLVYLKKQEVIMTIIWISLLINFLFASFEVGYSYILIEKLKMSSEHFGFTEGAFAIGMLGMSIYFSMRKEVKFPLLVSKRGILMMGIILGSVSVPLIISMPYGVMFAYYAFVMFSFGSMVIIVNTPIQVMMQKKIDEEYKGRVFSILETMSIALMPLGMVIFGFLYDILPGQWILLGSSTILIIIVLILARPSVVKKAHPELANKKEISNEVSSAL
ncbi:MFS transporter [Ferdinandcohnia quinoae]|uniref:MFS transporter n=1 Tax=Fredinandcohnia quinoae TaxID=2918902 RepID=A0AAW5E5P1_9BACI|nr:MFS transporter [Fredinandcohnia sp. SECRCQ15]MCH1626555.1 MFS transporter [Fredinandcohnia sp. SECRCQ15]